ncbi:hypothetical protein [Dyella monticola]|uniref:hypothetical protein n=1 Tax=Dyella monticola TaxID=1927958 RepID=UPI0011C07795|nr:hypothetical protein [Dyella monticola]
MRVNALGDCERIAGTTKKNQAIIAASMDTQMATQAANRLLSISVSNFMAALRKLNDCGFQGRCSKADANRPETAQTA